VNRASGPKELRTLAALQPTSLVPFQDGSSARIRPGRTHLRSNSLPIIGRLPRKLTSVTIGVVGFSGAVMFLLPTGCGEGGGSSWERCTTMMGTPAFSFSEWGLAPQFDILIPLAVGVLAAAVTWWLLGPKDSDSA
jgi:hypothetical protein